MFYKLNLYSMSVSLTKGIQSTWYYYKLTSIFLGDYICYWQNWLIERKFLVKSNPFLTVTQTQAVVVLPYLVYLVIRVSLSLPPDFLLHHCSFFSKVRWSTSKFNTAEWPHGYQVSTLEIYIQGFQGISDTGY